MSICDKWKNNPDINPRSNRYILKGGGVYDKLEKECGAPYTSRKPSLDCFEWHGNPLVNPKTYKTIRRDGPAYRKLEKRCGSPPKLGPSRYRSRSRSRSRSRAIPNNLDCMEWRADRTHNPITNRPIKRGGSVYKKMERYCKV